MKAIHTNWTLPFKQKNQEKYFIEDYEILTTILSALKWRQYNGFIKMYTDQVGYNFYKELNILDIWNEIDTALLDHMDYTIDPSIFWAAAKIVCLKNEDVPVCVLDTDLIIWQDLSSLCDKRDLVIVHKEEIFPDIYPAKQYLKIPKGYEFDPEWDWTIPALNAAFYYIANKELKELYTSESLRFMINNLEKPLENVTQMVFAEQRLFALCANKLSIQPEFLLNNPFDEKELVTHIWGYKQEVKRNHEKRRELCVNLVKKILINYPEKHSMLTNIPSVKPYLNHI
ncbi:MAG TPA: DUF6734 family protein [Bacteroidales bacterium]